MASLSKEHLSLGMTVNLNEKNEIIIDEVDPKGPAYQTGQVKKGDQIISISNQKRRYRFPVLHWNRFPL